MSKKGATNSGSGAGQRRNKDTAMAARMKKLGIKRTSQKCPICYQTVSLSTYGIHIAVHK